MGLFRTSDGIISQAMPLTAAMIASIDQRPAWLFENQSGTLGTNLNSSVIYCGTMPADGTGSISVILPGVSSTGVFSLQLTNGGTEYVTANNVATTSDTGNGSGLTLDIVAFPATFSGPVGGDGDYTIGAIDTFVPALAGASGTIDSMLQSTLTLTQGGSGYNETLPYTYATTPPAPSFTGPTGGNGRYIAPSNTSFTQVTSFSPAGAVGTIDNGGFPGGIGFGNPTSITITGGLDSYADGTVVEILQVVDTGGYTPPDYFADIEYPTSQPSGSNILYGVQTPSGGNIPQIGNKLISQQPMAPGGGTSKIPAGTSITAVSESGGIYTLTLSANTTGSFSGGIFDDELKIYKNVGYGSTFTVSRNGGGSGTGLTMSVTGTSSAPGSFTGPTGGNLAYVVSLDSDGFPTTDLISTTFSPAGAVGIITAVGSQSGSSKFLDDAGVPTAITITSGLDSYAAGTVVEILQTLNASGIQQTQNEVIASGGAPSGATQIVLEFGESLNSNYGPGNPVIMQTSNSDNGKIPSGTTITAVSADRTTITISAATTAASSYGDEIAVTSTTAFGSTFTVVAGATGVITTFAIDNPGSGYNIGDVVSPTLIGAGTPATFSVVAPYSTGNPATVTLAGIGGYTVGQEVEIQQTGGSTSFTGSTNASEQSPTLTLQLDSVAQPIQVGDAVSPISNQIPAGTTVVNVSSPLSPILSQSTGPYSLNPSTTITFSRSSAPSSGSKITITESANVVASATVGNNAGVNYSVGDIITIAQAGSDLNATLVVSKRALKPLVSQAVTFTGLQSGSILPVSVDYVTAVGGGTGADPVTVANFIVGR